MSPKCLCFLSLSLCQVRAFTVCESSIMFDLLPMWLNGAGQIGCVITEWNLMPFHDFPLYNYYCMWCWSSVTVAGILKVYSYANMVSQFVWLICTVLKLGVWCWFLWFQSGSVLREGGRPHVCVCSDAGIFWKGQQIRWIRGQTAHAANMARISSTKCVI